MLNNIKEQIWKKEIAKKTKFAKKQNEGTNKNSKNLL